MAAPNGDTLGPAHIARIKFPEVIKMTDDIIQRAREALNYISSEHSNPLSPGRIDLALSDLKAAIDLLVPVPLEDVVNAVTHNDVDAVQELLQHRITAEGWSFNDLDIDADVKTVRGRASTESSSAEVFRRTLNDIDEAIDDHREDRIQACDDVLRLRLTNTIAGLSEARRIFIAAINGEVL